MKKLFLTALVLSVIAVFSIGPAYAEGVKGSDPTCVVYSKQELINLLPSEDAALVNTLDWSVESDRQLTNLILESHAEVLLANNTQYHCPAGTLWCVTYFCNTVGLYCCPAGFPYLNHYDCLCYNQPPDVNSYSYCMPR